MITTLRGFSKACTVLSTLKSSRLSPSPRLHKSLHEHRLREIHNTSLVKDDANPSPSRISTYWKIQDIIYNREDGTKRSRFLGIVIGLTTILLAQTAFVAIENLTHSNNQYLYNHLLVIRATASNYPSPDSTTDEFISYLKSLEKVLMATKNAPEDFPECITRLENYLRAHEADINRYELTQEEWYHDGNLIPEALNYLEGPEFAKAFMSSIGAHLLDELLDNVDWGTEMLFAHAIRTVFLSLDLALAKLYEEDKNGEPHGSSEPEQSSFEVVA